MQTSKIKTTQASGTYVSKFDGATMYTSEVQLEDGTVGEVSAKSADRWNVGDEVEYSTKETPHGLKLKLNRPDFGSNPTSTGTTVSRFQDRQDIILNEWAIGRAMEWEMNQAPPDKVSLRNAVNLAKQLKKYALDLEAANVEVPEMELEPPY
jgi:hypothetical protein